MVCRLNNTKKAVHLFDGWNETIIWSCLDGTMGAIYVDNAKYPKSAMAVLGDFCFFAGEPTAELVLYKPDKSKGFMIIIPQNYGWTELIRSAFGNRAKETVRYAIKKEKNVFDKEKLKGAVNSLSDGFELRMIDEKLFEKCRENVWSRDLVSNYKDYGEYKKLGLGAVILKNGELVSGASSYSSYNGGIEIEIDTKEEYRRKGLAYTCGARLILECIKSDLYPSWDAQNLNSVALAEKLGYHFDREYTVFEITY